MSQGADLPLPPRELLRRIGPMGEVDPVRAYEESGAEHRELLERTLPDDWAWEGKRVLDFGCGVGRVLRQFAPETGTGEFWGCDLDRPSMDWNRANLEPPFRFFETTETAGLPQADGYFDFVYAFSVYTHFTDNWAGWLLEHHRVLAAGGYLFATYLGEGMLEPFTGEPWDESRIGMNPVMHGFSWDSGGPLAFNSPWWIRAHWGRLFEIVELVPRLKPDEPAHGIVLARKKPVTLSVEDLVALEPDEPREIAALQHHVEQLAGEVQRLRIAHDMQAAQIEALRVQEAELERLRGSSSWRLTAPLRAAKRELLERRR